MEISYKDSKLKLVKGDITKLKVEAIVNAANSSLLGGGGVDGAIHNAGGKTILEECIVIRNKQGSCPPGEAVITSAGKLAAKYVIHTVGPVWNDGKRGEAELLANCYRNSLRLAVENKVKTIAFPGISTGVYHFPKDRAAKIAVEEVKAFLEKNKELEEVVFVCFDEESYKLYQEILDKE